METLESRHINKSYVLQFRIKKKNYDTLWTDYATYDGNERDPEYFLRSAKALKLQGIEFRLIKRVKITEEYFR